MCTRRMYVYVVVEAIAVPVNQYSHCSMDAQSYIILCVLNIVLEIKPTTYA